MALKKKSETVDSGELIALIRDLVTQQSKVLEVAMETQKAQAEVLQKWIGMFTPSQTPNPSSSEADRIRLREELQASEDWEPVGFNPFSIEDMN